MCIYNKFIFNNIFSFLLYKNQIYPPISSPSANNIFLKNNKKKKRRNLKSLKSLKKIWKLEKNRPCVEKGISTAKIRF